MSTCRFLGQLSIRRRLVCVHVQVVEVAGGMECSSRSHGTSLEEDDCDVVAAGLEDFTPLSMMLW